MVPPDVSPSRTLEERCYFLARSLPPRSSDLLSFIPYDSGPILRSFVKRVFLPHVV